MDPNRLKDLLACPYCSGAISFGGDYFCQECDETFPYRDGQADFQPTKSISKALDYDLGGVDIQDITEIDGMPGEEIPEELRDIKTPSHMTDARLSYIPIAESGTALDLGCGDGVHRELCEKAGYNWIGLDVASDDAPILGDSHTLPFDDDTFDFILSIAALEHMENPFLAMSEAARVLKSGGVFLGTVAFLEPYHARSYFHPSPLGTAHVLDAAGFDVERLDAGWPVLRAQATNALFPKMPDILSSALVAPLQKLHEVWYRAGRLVSDDRRGTERYRRLRTAGAIEFLVSKS